MSNAGGSTTEVDGDPGGDRGARLDAALAEYLEAEDAGRPIEPDHWLAKYPDLAGDLRALLDDRRRLGPLLEPTRPDGGDHGAESTVIYYSDRATTVLAETAPNGKAAVPPGPIDPRHRRFGDYELIKMLGKGGMGVVYQARQISLDRMVALKMIRGGHLAGDEALRRFRNEAEAVARLDHPNLLKIFEIGEHDGLRYFTMPLVGGGSVADHLASYLDDPRRSARLVADIARAIHHAHERGVLHRDLKPANVLVDESGRPFVSDFGLAKRIDLDESASRDIIGTPAYMSPEQAAGRHAAVTIASDIYGLGAILYALLAGRSPFPGESAVEILRRVCDEGPERPSRWNARVDRGLEAICLRCLEKDPKHRYASAEALADDLGRWLEGRPIEARPVSAPTRFWMWCRRRPALAATAAALAISLVVGSVGIVINWLEVRRQKDLLAVAGARAGRERDAARALNEFVLEDILHQASPLGARTRALTVEDLLDRSASTIQARFASRPDLEASIRRVIADSYRAAGRLEKAHEQIEIALKIMAGMPEIDRGEQLEAWHVMGGVLLARDRPREALGYATRAHEGRVRHLGATHPDTLESANLLASVYMALGQGGQAERLLERTYKTARASLGDGHRTTLDILVNLAALARGRGALGGAERSYRLVRDEKARAFGPDHPDTLVSSSNLGAVLLDEGRAAEAESLLGPTLEASRSVLGEGHPLTLSVANNLASAQNQMGRFAEAGRNLAEVVRGRESTQGESHVDTLLAKNNLANNLLARGEYARALGPMIDVLSKLRDKLPHGDPRLADAMINLAVALDGTGSFAKANAVAEEAVALYRAAPGQDASTITALAHQASILIDAREFDRAETLARQVLDFRQKSPRTEPWRVAIARCLLGAALAGKGEFAEAEPLLLAGSEGVLADPKATPSAVARAIESVARMYDESGRPEIAALWRGIPRNHAGP